MDRPTGSLIGALLMVLLGVITFDEAVGAIDFNTIALLLGMMVLIAYLAMAGFLDLVATRIVRVARTPFHLLVFVVLSSGALSALLVNDTVVLIYTPILIKAVRKAGLRPVPYLVALATSANIGSAATIVGNPQNMLIGVTSAIPFLTFALHMAPVAMAGLALDILVIYLIYRRDIAGATLTTRLPDPPVDMQLMGRTLGVLAMVLVAFAAGGNYISVPMAALTGAALMFLLGSAEPSVVLKRVDWSLLFFFANLFIVMHGLAASGLTEVLEGRLSPLLTMTTGMGMVMGLSTLSVAVSNLVSNVPFVMMMLPFSGGQTDLFWYTLAMSSTFAGNLTLIGSVCNLIVAGAAREAGVDVGFVEFLKAGVPVTILTVLAGGAVLSLY